MHIKLSCAGMRVAGCVSKALLALRENLSNQIDILTDHKGDENWHCQIPQNNLRGYRIGSPTCGQRTWESSCRCNTVDGGW